MYNNASVVVGYSVFPKCIRLLVALLIFTAPALKLTLVG
jgi:hypothetical protein